MSTKKNFALIGAAGYVAPRHMQAIRETKNDLIAALDPNDSVGVIDSYFPEANFFTEFERFDRHIDKLRRTKNNKRVEYISITSPNYLHDSHIRFALRSDTHVVCEKPLVLNPWNVDGLLDIEKSTGKLVNTILQLRLHPSIISLRDRVSSEKLEKKYEVDLTYITSRGKWYMQSWKGDDKKSGGVATNIGVHFFDMLYYVFGDLQENIVHYASDTSVAGFLEYEKARVRWFLSIDKNDLPKESRASNQSTFRSITCNGAEIDFSKGFEDLHTKSYEEILAGNGFKLEDNRVSIQTVSDIRTLPIKGMKGEFHPYLKNKAND